MMRATRRRVALAAVATMIVVSVAWAATRSGGVASVGPSITIVGDSNRDGVVDAADLAGRETWSWARGAFVLPNVDDDDRDGRVDAEDTRVNGADDEHDLARVLIHRDLAKGTRLAFDAGDAPVHVFERTASGWRYVDLRAGGEIDGGGTGDIELGIETCRFAGQAGWDGGATLRVVARDSAGTEVGRDEVALRAAPWIALPSSARTDVLYVATGVYPNAPFIVDLARILPALGVDLAPPFVTSRWEEMWMQDTLELGYAEIPGGARMYVVLQGLRGADAFGPTLLAPGTGIVAVGEPRTLASEDQWSDWFGNLEVTPPVPGYPLGRVYYGKDIVTGQSLSPSIVRFIEAQGVQPPFWVDTSWLAIKHVDEIVTFLPGKDGRCVMVMASAADGGRLDPSGWDSYNQQIETKLSDILDGATYAIDGKLERHAGLKQLLGLANDQVVRVPVLYEPERLDGWTRDGAHNRWSNPVNSLYLNGVVVTGSSSVPDAVRTAIQRAFRRAGARAVQFVDDDPYQRHWGNVHCATNTRRRPVVDGFWRALPISAGRP